jgi:ABC-2 type transport system ATP-binding protein
LAASRKRGGGHDPDRGGAELRGDRPVLGHHPDQLRQLVVADRAADPRVGGDAGEGAARGDLAQAAGIDVRDEQAGGVRPDVDAGATHGRGRNVAMMAAVHQTDAVIEVADLHKAYGSHAAVRGLSLSVAAARSTACSAQRGRQDDHGGDTRGLPRADFGNGLGAGHGSARALRRAARTRRDGAAELRLPSAPLPARGRLPLGRACTGRRATSTRCSTLVGLQTPPTSAAERSRAARAAASTSRWRWSEIRRSSSSTSRPPASTRRPAAAWETIRGLRALGKTILLTTHYLDEAQALADRVGIIKDGRLVVEGAPAELDSGAPRYRVAYRLGGVAHEHVTPEPTRLLHELTSRALADGMELESLSVTRPTLEDVYLELTGDEVLAA